MDKKRTGRTVRGPARIVFPLGKFLERLHQCIGGSGPIVPSRSTECPAFGRDHPDHELSAGDFRVEYLWSHIMKKFDDGKPSDAKRDAALASMMEAENQCSSVPSRVARARNDCRAEIPTLSQFCTIDALIHTASRKISLVLGDFRWADALDYVGFGPGATTNLPRSRADLWYKFGVVPQASTACVPLVNAYLGRCNPLWKRALLEEGGVCYSILDANKVTTVPKNYKTDRPIAIEPQWNMFFQKGIGGLLRSRLRSVAVDLNDQSVNRDRAMLGSKNGSLATIDLSNASDTVSRWLVHELLPADWVAAMERCRSPYSVLPSGERILLRKFSSMGNGFTFELESLIFWAISSAVVQFVRKDSKLKDHRVSVYGDDIIVPVDCYDPVCEALIALGFTPNREKSYAAGPFRESCGMHAFNGHDVTPFYIRKPVDTLQDLFLLHNNLVRWAGLRYSGARDGSLQELARWVRSFAPAEWRRPRLPDGYGDGAFIGSFDECRPNASQLPRSKKTPWYGGGGFEIEVWVEKPTRFDTRRALRALSRGLNPRFEDTPRLLRSLWHQHVYSTAEARDLSRRARFQSDAPKDVSISRGAYGVSRVYVWKWNDLSPWVDFQDDMCMDPPSGDPSTNTV